MRLHQRKKARVGLQVWRKPQRNGPLDDEQWAQLDRELPVRVIRYRVKQEGFRTQEVYLVTTLLDEQKYPDEALAQLYFERWGVELFFRDAKVTLGLSPAL